LVDFDIHIRSLGRFAVACSSVDSFTCRSSIPSVDFDIPVRSVDSLSFGRVDSFGRVPTLDTIISLHVYAGRDFRCALDGRLSRCTLGGRLPMRPRRTTSMPSTDDFLYALDGRLPRRTTSVHSPRVAFAMRPPGDFSGLAVCPRRITFRCAPRRTTSAPNGLRCALDGRLFFGRCAFPVAFGASYLITFDAPSRRLLRAGASRVDGVQNLRPAGLIT